MTKYIRRLGYSQEISVHTQKWVYEARRHTSKRIKRGRPIYYHTYSNALLKLKYHNMTCHLYTGFKLGPPKGCLGKS